MNEPKWTNIMYIPQRIVIPRDGLIGALLDFVWPRSIDNPHPFANHFIAVDEEGNVVSSVNGIEWTLSAKRVALVGSAAHER